MRAETLENIESDSQDIPGGIDMHGPAMVSGVETEEVEGMNEAYDDILEEFGIARKTEDDFEEVMPSCIPILIFDYLIMKLESIWKIK